MTSKKRQRTSLKQSLQNAFGPDTNEPTRPTVKQWDKMDQAEELVMGKHRYKQGCDALVRSADSPKNKWIGRLCSIRRRRHPDGASECWVLIQWYYSSRDLGETPGLSLSESVLESFHANERVLSDVYDVIAGNTFKGTTHVYLYNEESLDPPAIDPGRHFFVRYDLTNILTKPKPKMIPFPGQFTCICNMPYNPWPEEVQLAKAATQQFYARGSKAQPTELERKGDYMHFCPRPACSTWFHESCLIEPIREADFVASPKVRRLAVDPDRSQPCAQLAKYAYEKPPRGKMSHDGGLPTVDDILSSFEYFQPPTPPLPKALIEVAAMPILKRAGEGTFSTAGNVADVVLARRLVYQALDGWHSDLERVEKKLDESWYNGAGDENMRNNMWRFLSSQRVLATPYAGYWEKLAQKLEVHADRPVLHCPNCTKDNLPVVI